MAGMADGERTGEQEAMANALRGISRDVLVLIDTPDGPKRLCMVAGSHVAEREGRMVRHAQSERYTVILQAER